MPKYFTHLSRNNAPKNALQSRVIDLLIANSDRLIDDPKQFVKASPARSSSLF